MKTRRKKKKCKNIITWTSNNDDVILIGGYLLWVHAGASAPARLMVLGIDLLLERVWASSTEERDGDTIANKVTQLARFQVNRSLRWLLSCFLVVFPCCISLACFLGAFPWRVSLLHILVVFPSCVSLSRFFVAFPCCDAFPWRVALLH